MNVAKTLRPEDITVRAYVTVNGERVDVDTLTPEYRKRLATAIRTTYLNELFRGQAVFTPKEGAECDTLV